MNIWIPERVGMLSGERHEKILRELEMRGSLTVNGFAEKTGLSTMTIRRDLTQLAAQGLLRRVHGGAVPVPSERPGDTVHRRSRQPLATLGLIVPTTGYYFPEVIRGAESAARELNARLILGVSNYSAEDEHRQLQRMVANSVDGILLATAGSLEPGSPTFELLSGLRIPVVLVERSSRVFESVMSDHSYGAELALEHLASLGHRRIGLAIATSPTAPWLRESHERMVAKLGLETDAPIMEYVRSVVGAGNNQKEFAKFLRDCRRTETHAALVLPDEEAITLINLAEEAGLDVPEDLAIVAYDDEVADLAPVPLTSIAPPKRDVGHAAVAMCMERLAGKTGSAVSPALRRVSLAPKLIIRESTVPGEDVE
ncbi:substrate-binding domain-containing protein [Arthrobacter sp. Rue61a]|uniref:substrate-binding domain-containing protein n=1 Tax=Arthrobacter sp. Rue61a TaxID=1118963 RepID=UPI00027DF2A3|nr:substrate-binding domain-containing protein [Arthrobacter sp. Rue61a]AFR30621.1 arabinose metabolism transcriptional repressor AraR [Arthrobacter sp. Rue61a]